jgi:O-antigen ligase
MPSPVTLGFALVVLPLVVLGAIRWQRAILTALPFLVVVDGLSISAGGVSVRPSQFAASLLVIALAASTLIGARRMRTDATTWWLAAILAVNVAATALNSPVRMYSALQCVNLATVWVIYVLVINLADTRADLDALLGNVLLAAIGASGVAIVAYVFAVIGLPIGGAEVSKGAVEHLTNAYGAYGTMLEPNLFGSFTGAHLVMAMALLVVGMQRAEAAVHTRLARWTAAVVAVGLVLSFTRAAWLGALAGLAMFAVFGPRSVGVRVPLRRLVAPLGVGLAVVVVLLLLPGDAGTLFRFKIFNLVNLESQTVVLRALTYNMALEQTAAHPVIGAGTFTFAALTAQGSDFQQFENWRNLWIGNYLLLALHDTGVVGLVLWGGLLWSILSRGARLARDLRDTDVALASQIFALTLAAASLLIPFLATTGFTLAYPWLLIGLLGGYCRLAVEPRLAPAQREPAATPAPLPADAT